MVKRHKLEEIEAAVEHTHNGLGQACMAALISAKARKCFLLVAPPGTGKSTITDSILNNFKPSISRDAGSMAGFRHIAAMLTNLEGTIVVDDIAILGSTYAMLSTISAYAALTYTHNLSRDMADSHYQISDFHAGVVMNVQPIVLKHIVPSPVWEANIKDKTIRYYHLYRPQHPTIEKVQYEIGKHLPLAKVAFNGIADKYMRDIEDTFSPQWSISRVNQHVQDLLKAIAALDESPEVRNQDVELLLRVFAPLKLEKYAMFKRDLEEGREFNATLILLLTELASYGKFELSRIQRNYEVSQSTAYAILNKYKQYVDITNKTPTYYVASELAKKIFADIGVKYAD